MPEILFPILTGLTLLFFGILVGYFLWYRDRSEQDELHQELVAENKKLRIDLEGNVNRIDELDEKLALYQSKNNSLVQLCDELRNAKAKSLEQTSDFQSELATLRRNLDLARKQVNDECQKRTISEEKLISAKQEFLELKANSDSQTQQKISAISAKLAKVQGDLQRQTLLKNQLEQRLQNSTSESAKLKSELAAQRDILDTAKSNAVGLEKEYITVETKLRGQIELLKESRGQAAAALSAKDIAELALRENREHLQTLGEKLEKLELENREYSKYKERCEHFELSMQLVQERVDSLLAQRDDFGTQKKQAELELVALQHRNRNQQTTIEQLRSQATATDERRQKNQQELLQKIKQLEAVKVDLNSKCDSLETKISEADSWRQKTDESFKRISEENAILIAKVQEFEKMDQDALVASEGYKARIESVLTQRDSAMNQLQELNEEMKRLRNHAKSNEETIRSLRRERGAILMRNREYASSSYPRIHNESLEFSKADQISSEYGGTIKTDPVRGPIFVEPPRQRDDLKKIYGIAKVLEERLNEFGIFTFKQIMEWDKQAIKEFSELLAFKDRITRDDWKGQAERLYVQKNKSVA